MTAMSSGMPSPFSGPERPLPGGRDEHREQEREARRVAARLAAAQRRLGQPGPAGPSLPTAIVEELTETSNVTGMRGLLHRVGALWRPGVAGPDPQPK